MIRSFSKTFDRLMQLPLGLHAGLAVLSFAAFQGVQIALNASYAASRFPVDYKTGQLAFSGETLEGYYAVMQDAGTLGVYLRTQVIDYGFILGTAVVGMVLASLVARLALRRGPVRIGAMIVAALAVLGAGFDAAENLVSFVLLANPNDIAEPLALLYSALAAAKFACLMPATTLFFVVLAAGLIARGHALLRQTRLG